MLLSILVINPNSSRSVTEGLQEAVRPPPETILTFYTAPEDAPESINDATTGTLSAAACFKDIVSKKLIDEHDGFVVSCFSDHPLIHMLREKTHKPVIGILEASVAHALLCGHRFGIVSTGADLYRYDRYVEVRAVLGGSSDKFAGMVASQLGVVELREGDRLDVEEKMKKASGRVAALGSDVIILGCAGMAGMEDVVKAGVREAGYGPVRVVDGNKAGVEFVAALARLQ
ncbi:Asp/Glu/hydantoin racemase [Mycena filopes]|nr:Asp/Glu/hydantoin racemase [Mycena filopes]